MELAILLASHTVWCEVGSAIDKCFLLVDAGQKGPKRKATGGKEREASVVIICTMHQT